MYILVEDITHLKSLSEPGRDFFIPLNEKDRHKMYIIYDFEADTFEVYDETTDMDLSFNESQLYSHSVIGEALVTDNLYAESSIAI